MISLNSSTMWEAQDAPRCRDDAPGVQRLENFGTETQNASWDVVGSRPRPPAGRRDMGMRFRPSEMQSVPDLSHRSHVQMPLSSRLESVELFTDVEEEEETGDGKSDGSGHTHVPLSDVSSGSETDDERSLHNAMSHLNVNHHDDTNTETKDKEKQCVTSDSDINGDAGISDTTVSAADITCSDMVVSNTVRIDQDNPTDETVHVTGDNSVNERSFCDTRDTTHNYTLVGGGVQRCSPLVEMDSHRECRPLVGGSDKCEIFGADLVTLRDSGCYDASQNSSLDGNIPTSASYPNMAVGQPADICMVAKYASWATS